VTICIVARCLIEKWASVVSEEQIKQKKLRVVFISSCNPTEIKIIKEVSRVCQLTGVVKIFWQPGAAKKKDWKKRVLHPFSTVSNIVNRNYLENRIWKRRREISKLLPECASLPEAFNTIEVPTTSINSQSTIQKISLLNPDIILVGGAPILRPEVFSLARLASFNIHYGIAPAYRGEHTIFWPLMKGDFDNVGITIHHVAKKVDAGRVMAYGYPELTPADSENSLICKCALLASELLCDLISSIDSASGSVSPGYLPDSGGSQLVRYNDRKIWHDLAFALKRPRPLFRPQRVVKYYKSATESDAKRYVWYDDKRIHHEATVST